MQQAGIVSTHVLEALPVENSTNLEPARVLQATLRQSIESPDKAPPTDLRFSGGVYASRTEPRATTAAPP